jgi:hypothetical protein
LLINDRDYLPSNNIYFKNNIYVTIGVTVKKLLPSDKDMEWYLDQMDSHVKEIRELTKAGEKPYGGEKTCREHARVEAYDLIVLTSEAFGMEDVIDSVPVEIIERFNRKRKS